MVWQAKEYLPFKHAAAPRLNLVSTQTSEVTMSLTLSEAKSFAPTNKEDTLTDASETPVKKALSVISKRFWAYTKATGEADTKSFEGLL